MNYNDFRPAIKTGDLLAFSHVSWETWRDWLNHAVRFYTESEFSHVGMAYVINDRVFVLEAVAEGVRMFPLSTSLPFYHVSNPKPLTETAANYAFNKLGVKYENRFKMLLNVFFNMELNKNGRLQCSEYFNLILRANDQFLTVIDTPAAIVGSAMKRWGPLTYVEEESNV